MRLRWQVLATLGLGIAALSGCRAPQASSHSDFWQPLPEPTPFTSAAALPTVSQSSLIPSLDEIPDFPDAGLDQSIFLGLTVAEAVQMSANAAESVPDSEALPEELKRYAKQAQSIRAANEAVAEYFRLAEAEARIELLGDGLEVAKELLEVVRSARERGIGIPQQPSQIEEQILQWESKLAEAELGLAAIDLDLKRKLNLDRQTGRIHPLGPFPVEIIETETDSDVRTAKELRPDLQLLRAAYHRLTPDTVRQVRDKLAEQLPDPLAGLPFLQRRAKRLASNLPTQNLEEAARAELIAARQYLYKQIELRERRIESEVSAANEQLQARQRVLTLAKQRVMKLRERVDQVESRGPLFTLPARLELLQARNDLTEAYFAWHRAKWERLAAIGQILEANDGMAQFPEERP